MICNGLRKRSFSSLQSNQITTLPSSVFSGLTSLNRLFAYLLLIHGYQVSNAVTYCDDDHHYHQEHIFTKLSLMIMSAIKGIVDSVLNIFYIEPFSDAVFVFIIEWLVIS